MKKIIDYLQQLGFSEVEIKIYLILLKSDPLTVSQLAEKAKLNRTALYSHLNDLLEKGIIAKVKGSSNKIAASPPEHLQYLIEQKITSAMHLKDAFPSIVASLNSSFPKVKNATPSEMKYYKGKTGVKKIYEDCLKVKELRSYFNATDIVKIFPENFKLFDNAFIHNPQIKMFEIVERDLASMRETERSQKIDRYYYKFLPDDIKLTANDILIYDGKVAIINIRDKNSIEGVVLENQDYYNNSVQLFDLLWRLLPGPNI